MKKNLWGIILMAYPSLLSAIFTLLISVFWIPGVVVDLFILACYILTACGFYFYVKKKPFALRYLFISFAPVPVFTYIYESLSSGLFSYFGTFLVIILYVIPCIAVSLVIALVLTINEIRKYRK